MPENVFYTFPLIKCVCTCAIFSLKYILIDYSQYFLNLYISLYICVSRFINNNT